MNEEKTQLLSCPFCGSRGSLFPSSDHSTAWEGGCSSVRGCPVTPQVWELTEAEAIAAWNRRASPSVNEEKTEAAGGVELLRRALAALDTLAGDINGFGPVDYPDEIATIEAVRRRVDGVPTCERPNLRSLWGCCKLGSGCQCTSSAQQGECEHRADGVLATCVWQEEDPNGNMPGTYESACGELWSFTDGGVKENNVRFCQGCGKPVEVVPFPEPTDEEAAIGVAIPHGGRDEL